VNGGCTPKPLHLELLMRCSHRQTHRATHHMTNSRDNPQAKKKWIELFFSNEMFKWKEKLLNYRPIVLWKRVEKLKKWV
jgi:hypothetical protein